MTGGPRIIPIESDQAGHPSVDTVLELEDAAKAAAPDWEIGEEELAPVRADWLPGFLVGFAITGWTGFFIWASLPRFLAGLTPAEGAEWVVQWSIPVLLVLVVLLVTMRTSRREGARFGDIARSLNSESRLLEERLKVVNGELSIARDFIASQSRDLEALGRIAAERLSGSASQLAGLVSDNGQKVDTIATVAQNALENMEKLRGQLPVIANAAKDVTNNIANAGRTAHVQLEDMVTGFQRLNEFGVASERQVRTIRDGVGAALEELATQADRLATLADERLARIAADGEAVRHRLDQDEIAALAAIRARASALGEELASNRMAAEASESEALGAIRSRIAALREESARVAGEIATGEANALAAWTDRAAAHAATLREALASLDANHRATIEAGSARLSQFTDDASAMSARIREEMARLENEADERRAAADAAAEAAAESLAQRLQQLEQVVAEHQERQFLRAKEVAEHCATIGERVKAFTAMVGSAGAQGEQTGRAVEAAMVMLNAKLTESRESLAGTDSQVAALTDASVRLLELIQASSDHSRTHIPQALSAAEAGLRGIEDRVFTLRDTLSQAGDSGRSLSDYVIQTRHEVGSAMGDLARLQDELGERTIAQEQRIAALRETLGHVRQESEALSAQVDSALSGTIARLRDAARQAGEEIDAPGRERIEALASKLGEDGSAAIARLLEDQVKALAEGIDSAVSRAAASSRDAAVLLRDQLAKVDELAGNLESRVDRARERAQEQVDSDFARRVALITESLNSTAIDVAKVLSSEVTDTAWAAYLRGDRGIFTRRAVNLLDSAESKVVLQHYERDAEFRDHVNHYIHDFEAMLRQLLSTRDGNALGVTLLSSDMGKLYVALAQAIERLRA